jgi:drug/metabolite transporter (DMT)-like permease
MAQERFIYAIVPENDGHSFGKKSYFPCMNQSTKGLISILFVMIVWGSASSVTKIAVNEIPPFALAFLRFATALITLLLMRPFSSSTNDTPLPWAPIAFMGLSGVTVFYVFFNLSLLYTSASIGSLIQGFIPVSIAIFAVIFLKERLSVLQIMGILLSVAGIVIIGMLANNGPGAQSSVKGTLYMILASLSWAVYTVLSKKVVSADALKVTIGVAFTGVLFLLPFAVAESWKTGVPTISWRGWVAVVYLGSIGSALCYFLYNKAMEVMSAAQVGNFLNLDPVIGLIIALIFLGEHINMLQAMGGLLVIGGVFLSSWKGRG